MQYPQRMLAVIASHPSEFIQDLAAFPPARRPITFSRRLFEFSRVAMLNCLAISSTTPQLRCRVAVYVRQRAADSVTKIVSQCAGKNS